MVKASGWSTVFLLAVSAAVAQAFGRFAYGILLPAVRDDLGLSNTVAGTLGTVNVGAYLVGTMAVATVSSRFRLMGIMRFGITSSTLGLSLAAFAPTEILVGVALFLTGIGGACIWIPAPAIAADAVPLKQRPIAVACTGAGIGAGMVFSALLSSYLRSQNGDEAWRSVFTILAGIALVVLAAILLALRHDQPKPEGRGAGIGGFATLTRMRGWKALTLAYLAFGFCYLLVIAFLTSRLEDDSGWSEASAGLAFTVLSVATVFGGLFLVSVARRLGPSKALFFGFVVWSVLVLSILPGLFSLTFVAVAGVGLMFGGVPTVITYYVVESTTAEDYGPTFAAATLAFGVAQMLAPQVGGVVADLSGSFAPVFILSACFALLGAGAAQRLPTIKNPASRQG